MISIQRWQSQALTVTALFAASVFASAQTSKKPTVVLSVTGPVELQRQADVLRDEVMAFPRVAANAAVPADIATRINAALQRADARVRASALDCRKSAQEAQNTPTPDAWQRDIDVTMRGPRFLAFLVTDSYDCGGPYPNFGMHMALVYDLTTGRPVNWRTLLPVAAEGTTDTASDGSTVGLMSWDVLNALSRKQAESECKNAFSPGDTTLTYLLNLNGRKGTLDAEPASFPHALQACADTVSLDTPALRKLGVSADVIHALEAAHALQKNPPAPAKKKH